MKRNHGPRMRLPRIALVDGMIHAAIFALLHGYTPSVYVADKQGELFFALAVAGAAVSALAYLLLFRQERRNKPLTVFSLVGVLWAAAFLILHHAVIFFTPLRLLPVRDPLYHVEGLLLLMVLGVYLVLAAALRLVFFIVLVVRNL